MLKKLHWFAHKNLELSFPVPEEYLRGHVLSSVFIPYIAVLAAPSLME